MKQKITNGDFKPIIDWGEKDITAYTPYEITSIYFGKPKWYKRLFAKKSKMIIDKIEYIIITISGVTYLYPIKKIKIISIRGIKYDE